MTGPTTYTLPTASRVQGDVIALRPWEAADAPALNAFADDPLTVQWAPLRRDGEGADAWIAKRATWDDHMSWAIVDAEDILLGGISVFQFDAASANANIGYWIAPPARGRGIAATATRMACEFAFTALPLVRIALFHSVFNEASCRVASKAGFAYEGTTRQSWRYPDGNLHDEHVHSILRTDPR